MRHSIYITIIGIMAMLFSCQDQDAVLLPSEVHEGYVPVSFHVDVPDMKVVTSRSIDPDGIDIQQLTLFCFNTYGIFISAIHADIVPQTDANSTQSTSGTFTASIPADTKIIHFTANLPDVFYKDQDFRGCSEEEVKANMEGATGKIVYWARFKCGTNEDISVKLKERFGNANTPLSLIRNHAKVFIGNWGSDTDASNTAPFVVTGFVTTNVYAFGTVAPYHIQYGFPTVGTSFEWPDGDYVTLAEDKSMMSDITDVDTKAEDYIFEHDNTYDNPVSVIIRGHKKGETKDLYYRAMLIDENGDFLKVRRNHAYKITISGELSFGQETFEAALKAPATNNAWATVDEWIKEINDGTNKLSLENTHIVLDQSHENQSYTFTYQLTDMDGETLADGAEVSWIGDNDIAMNSFSHRYADGTGTITLQLFSMNESEQSLSGSLLIKKGVLMRTVQIQMIKTQKFTPAWVSTQIYSNKTQEKVTLKFTIPETTPEALFPMSVMLSVKGMDVRSESGMELPVVTENDPTYFGENLMNLGYKYEYVANAPGVHRLYLETTQKHENNTEGKMYLEGKFFETLEKTYKFTNHQNAITVSGLYVLNSDQITGPGNTSYAQDEKVFYTLIPQKINAPVMFDMIMIDKSDQSPVNVIANDEFLLYSKSLDRYADEEFSSAKENPLFSSTLQGLSAFPCEFGVIDEDYWKTSTNGRVLPFRPRNTTNLESQYRIYMKTNRPVSEDVIRISSNVQGNKSAFNPTEDYAGTSYRSVIFELLNFHPFRFAAQVNGSGTWTQGTAFEIEEDIEWQYENLGKEVAISFDVTSFIGYTSENKTNSVSVDPFGTEFKVYIDAPMLEIDESKRGALTGSKFYKDSDGRFVYVVDAERVKEREFFADSEVAVKDAQTVNQKGERKTLHFKTNSICNIGTIKISSEKEKVVFYDKIFNVSNTLMDGTLKYCAPAGTQITKDEMNSAFVLPKNAFVSFALKSDGTRIGRITVEENGRYNLNLRKEYEFGWTDLLEMNYLVKEGDDYVSYDAFEIWVEENGSLVSKSLTLENLSRYKNVILTKAQ